MGTCELLRIHALFKKIPHVSTSVTSSFVILRQAWTPERTLTESLRLPKDWKQTLSAYDAIYFGAVGMPAKVPDHVSLWGSLLKFRREFDQYVNLRPCRLLKGVKSPLADRQPGEIDFWVVRENTEGEYSSIGGKMFEGTQRETVIQETVMTRTGVDRVLKYAFEMANKREGRKKHVTSATKSNGISITMPYWGECPSIAQLYFCRSKSRVLLRVLTLFFR